MEERWWHVRSHVAVRGAAGAEAEAIAKEEVACITRDDGNWSLAVVAAVALGPVEDDDEDGGAAEEDVVVTLEAAADRGEGAVSQVEYWLEGLYSPICRDLYVEREATLVDTPRGLAARSFLLVAETLGSPVDPYRESVRVGDTDVRVTLVDRYLSGKPFVQIYNLDLDEEHRGRGAGTRVVTALRDVTQSLGAELIIGPITNDGFWERFAWLREVDEHDLTDAAGGFATTVAAPFSRRQIALIRDW